MILFQNIVEILALANFYSSIIFLIKHMGAFFVGIAFVYINQAWLTISTDRFIEETQSCFGVMLGGEKKFDRISLFIDGTIAVFPLTFDFDIRLIKPPTITRSLLFL